jgi:peptide/nickel transport system permease protein
VSTELPLAGLHEELLLDVLEPSVSVASAWHRARHSRVLIAGGVITGAVVLLAVLAPVISPHSPQAQNLTDILAGPSSSHWFGTDELGRDVLSRMLYAARTDLKVGFLAVLIPFAVGVVLGVVAGVYGGWVDQVIMRVVDVVLAFPFYVLVIALVFVFGTGTRGIYVAVALVDWVAYARLVRSATLTVSQLDYVAAARAGGIGERRVLVRHVLPNVITQAIVYVMSDVVLIIVAVVTLGFLGLGVQPPTPDWGAMINEGQPFITTHWELATIPGLGVVLTGLGLSLLGDGLADVLRAS